MNLLQLLIAAIVVAIVWKVTTWIRWFTQESDLISEIIKTEPYHVPRQDVKYEPHANPEQRYHGLFALERRVGDMKADLQSCEEQLTATQNELGKYKQAYFLCRQKLKAQERPNGTWLTEIGRWYPTILKLQQQAKPPTRWYYHYVLLLEGGRIYVGRTGDVYARLWEHYRSRGAEWTRLHCPRKILWLQIGGEVMEYNLTIAYMAHQGIVNVRGSHYCQPVLSSGVIEKLTQVITQRSA